MIKWHDNDEFWDAMSHKLFAEKSPFETKKEIDQIIHLTGITPGSSILDLCCGQGRHSLEFARRGFKITGVDRTEKYLEHAKRESSRENLSIEYIKDDMRRFRRENHFNAIIVMYTSFGFFANQKENIKVLTNCYYSLNKNGKMLIDLVGKEILKKKFKEHESFVIDGITYIEKRKVIGDWEKIENKWIMIKENEQKEFILTHWVYSAEEMKELLSEAGFSSMKKYGDLSGSKYDENAQRLIAIAVK
jgi:ubiquinone/menaquinone biosynthesis C-methylase UbiE